jgi:hypothetical protein
MLRRWVPAVCTSAQQSELSAALYSQGMDSSDDDVLAAAKVQREEVDSGSGSGTPSASPRLQAYAIKLEKKVQKHEKQLLTQDHAIKELYLKMKASDDDGMVQQGVDESCAVVDIAAHELLRRRDVINQVTSEPGRFCVCLYGCFPSLFSPLQ